MSLRNAPWPPPQSWRRHFDKMMKQSEPARDLAAENCRRWAHGLRAVKHCVNPDCPGMDPEVQERLRELQRLR